jgi:hypothetical protein
MVSAKIRASKGVTGKFFKAKELRGPLKMARMGLAFLFLSMLTVYHFGEGNHANYLVFC